VGSDSKNGVRHQRALSPRLSMMIMNVIGHVTIGLGVGTFLLVVNDDHARILHGYEDTGLQRFWDHEFDLLGHVTSSVT